MSFLPFIGRSKENFSISSGLKDSFNNMDVGNSGSQINLLGISDKELSGIVDNYDIAEDKALDFMKAVQKGNFQLKQGETYVQAYTRYATKGFYLTAIKAKAAGMATMLMNTMLQMGITMLVSAGISMAVNAIDDYIHRVERAKEASERAKEKIDETNKTFEDQKKTLEESGKRYAELAQHVNQFNNTNLDLNEDEYKEFLQISNELAELFPDLTSRYDENGNAILNLNGTYGDINSTLEAYIKNLKEASELEAVRNFKGEGDRDDYFAGAKEIANSYKEEEFSGISYKDRLNAEKKSIDDFIKYVKDGKFEYAEGGFLNNIERYLGFADDDTQSLIFQSSEWFDIVKDYFKDGSDITKDEINEVYKKLETYLSQKESDLKNKIKSLNTSNKEISKYGQSVLKQSDTYTEQTDTAKNVMSSALTMIDWTSLNDVNSGKDAANYIENKLAYVISEVSNKVDQSDFNILQKFFEAPEDISLSEYLRLYDEVKNIFKSNKVEIPIGFEIDSAKEIQDKLDEQKKIFEKDNLSVKTYKKSDKEGVNSIGFKIRTDADRLEDYFKINNINSKDEIDAWNKRTEGAKSYAEAVEMYEKKAQEETQKTAEENKQSATSFKDAWKALDKIDTRDDNKDDDRFKDVKKSLTELADAGKLTDKEFKKNKDAVAWAKSLGLSISEVVKEVNSLTDSAKQLGSLKSAIGSIQDAYSSKKENKVVGADTLASMEATFGKLGKAWTKYKQVAGSTKTSLTDLKKAQNELATAYVNSNNFLSGLIDKTGKCTEANKQYYISQLQELGIKNAEEVVNESIIIEQEKLIDSKIEAAQKSDDFVNVLLSEVDGLQTEQGQIDITKQKYKDYIWEKALANKNVLDTSASIRNLNDLAIALGIVTDKINIYSMMAVKVGQLEANNQLLASGKVKGKAAEQITKENEELSKWIGKNKKKIKGTKVDVKGDAKGVDLDINPTKSGSGSGSSKDKSSKSNTKQEFDWIERRITSLTNKISLYNTQKENLFTVKNKNKNLNKQIKETTKLLNTYRSAASKYEAKANSVKLSSSLKKKVRNGQITGSYKSLIKEYGETTANRIQKYQDYYDKSRSAKQSTAEAETNIRNLQIEKLQNYVDHYDSLMNKFKELASNSALSYSKRNSYINDEIKNLKKSYEYQIKIANANKNTAEATRLQAELNREIVGLKKEQFDNVKTKYDRDIQRNTWDMDALDRAISEIEGRGQNVNRAYYDREKIINNENLSISREELSRLQSQIKNIPKYTDEWYDAQDDINDCLNRISDSVKTSYELTNKIHELYNKLFENTREQISRVNAEQEFLRGLFAHEKSFDADTGAITEAGLARLGSFTTSYYLSKGNAENDEDYLNSLLRMKNNGTWTAQFNSLDDLEKEIDSVYTTWQNDIKETYSVENDIFNMMKENYQAQLDALKKLIDKRKEALSIEKELHDYQRQIREKTTAITDTQRQIAAYRGDTSSEGMARMQRLQKQLADQQDDLRETEYDRYISDQQNMLDKLYSEFEELISKKLDEFMELVKEGLKIGDENATTTDKYLEEVAKDNGYNEQYSNTSGSAGVSATIEKLKQETESKSGTNANTKAPNNVASANSHSISGSWSPIVHTEGGKTYNLNYKSDAQDFIKWFLKKNVQTTKTKFSKLTDFNKAVYTDAGKLGTKKKILSTGNQKLLASYLGLNYDNSTRSGSLYKKVKSLGIKGFSHGGIVDIDDITKQVRANGDTGIASVKNGEGILTPVETKAFLKLADNLDAMNLATDLMKNYSSIPNVLDNLSNYGNNNSVNEVNYGGVNFNFDVHGNNPSEMIRAIQNNPQLQKAIEKVSVGKLTNNNRLGVRSIK